jgi:hypothetical protein
VLPAAASCSCGCGTSAGELVVFEEDPSESRKVKRRAGSGKLEGNRATTRATHMHFSFPATVVPSRRMLLFGPARFGSLIADRVGPGVPAHGSFGAGSAKGSCSGGGGTRPSFCLVGRRACHDVEDKQNNRHRCVVSFNYGTTARRRAPCAPRPTAIKCRAAEPLLQRGRVCDPRSEQETSQPPKRSLHLESGARRRSAANRDDDGVHKCDRLAEQGVRTIPWCLEDDK